MPLYTTDALILRTYTLGESDRLVVFLTRDRGKKRGVAKNARQSRRRFGGALEPLTCGRVGYFERERRELVTVNYVELTRSPLSALDAEALGYAGYFAGLIDEWAQEACFILFWLLEAIDDDRARKGNLRVGELQELFADDFACEESLGLIGQIILRIERLAFRQPIDDRPLEAIDVVSGGG